MKLFVDTANVDEIRQANDMGVICGVTTNPSSTLKIFVFTLINVHKAIASTLANKTRGHLPNEIIINSPSQIIFFYCNICYIFIQA